ncbi:glutathione S-transferase [Tepidamorphus sp. 3E244]|uniref:glutathione S-transferase n=1 Tax=Tepidamorphus sp. 3E244 TaxID=3385498 RepID=UPI0038FCEC41
MSELRLEDCVNETCPWSGDPVAADSLTLYRGQVVGFCNTGCRDKFETAVSAFDAKIATSEASRV